MDCKTTIRLCDELTAGRLREAETAELHRHLADCTDCRVAQQRAARLRQLLSVKRYEQPPPAYFDNFLSDFHRRLEAEEARPRWWQQFAGEFNFALTPVWRYGLAAAASLLLAFGLFWPATPSPVTVANPAKTTLAQVSASEHTTVSAASPILAPLAYNTASAPRYVLDRISVTPASYEVSSIRF